MLWQYGTTNGINQTFRRVESLKVSGEGGNLAAYIYIDAARYVKIANAESGIE